MLSNAFTRILNDWISWRVTVCTLWVAAGSLAAPGQTPAVAKPAQGAQTQVAVASGQACLKCHTEVTKSFAIGPHGKAAQFVKSDHAMSCDTCHGDPTRHNVNGNPGQIGSPTKLTSAEASGLCLRCHAREQTHVNWLGGAHDRRDMSCISCHKEHHVMGEKLPSRTGLRPTPLMLEKVSAKLLKQTSQEVCLTCHKDKRKAVMQRSTHLFATEHGDTKLTCTSCHNPHGGEGKAMLTASSNSQLCFSCHADKRGPFLWEHTPARENCNTCHVPHGSNNPNLLKARSTVLCQTCHMHMMWRHQTIAGFDIFTYNRGCANCHSQVHGSNHPSGKALTH
jgi:predicted CXXCH cytochrome family protein